MRVLMITPYVSIPGRKEFERNKTGFGYMVMDIAKSIGNQEQVTVLATDSRGEGFYKEGVEFLRRSLLSYLFRIRHCVSPVEVYRLWKQYHIGVGTLARETYYWLMTGYLKDLIEKEHFDIVHIHGCDFATELWMSVCKNSGKKFLITLHGLNSFSNTVKVDIAGKQYERDFLKRVIDGDIRITVISSGIRKLIEESYGKKGVRNIEVVCNSFSFNTKQERTYDVREKYSIPPSDKVLLYIGNISENKNQRQMVDACALLPDDIQHSTWVLFCGNPSVDGSFESYVSKCTNGCHYVLCGVVDKTEIANYYRAANGVALFSYAEGFGLSLVEGMNFGVPCAMFNDMEAYADIFDPCSVVAIEERRDDVVAKGLETLLLTNWDKKRIIDYSDKFSSERMAKNYIKVYNE